MLAADQTSGRAALENDIGRGGPVLEFKSVSRTRKRSVSNAPYPELLVRAWKAAVFQSFSGPGDVGDHARIHYKLRVPVDWHLSSSGRY
jgi:hypothetical protein